MAGIIDSIFSTAVERQIFTLGCLVGLLITVLWPKHKNVASFLLGVVVAITLGRSLSPWAPSYDASVQASPLAAKPWYFLLPVAVIIGIGVPLHRGVREWWAE